MSLSRPWARLALTPARLFGILAGLGALGAAVLVVAGFFGGAFRPLDSIAHFRAHLAVAVLLSAALAMALAPRIVRLASVGAALIGLFAVATVVPTYLPLSTGSAGARPAETASATTRRIRLLQMNLLWKAELDPALRTIAAVDADILTLQEVSDRWSAALRPLAERYPYRFDCNTRARGEIILSKFPFTDDPDLCRDGDGFIARGVDLGGGVRLTVASQHLKWPWPRDQWYQIAALEPVLPDLPKPLVVGGDFNAVPWSAAVTRFAEASGTRPVPGIGPTYLPRRLPAALKSVIGLPIDNVLVSDGITVVAARTLEPTASDHLPVLVTLDIAGDRARAQ